MKDHWDADRIENSVGRNIPDVWFRFGGHNGFTGWIELKQIFRWNAKTHMSTKVPHFTAGQKSWLYLNHRAGANTWVLLHVRLTDEYLFIPGSKVFRLGDCNRLEAFDLAYEVFHGMPSAAAARGILASKGEL